MHLKSSLLCFEQVRHIEIEDFSFVWQFQDLEEEHKPTVKFKAYKLMVSHGDSHSMSRIHLACHAKQT